VKLPSIALVGLLVVSPASALPAQPAHAQAAAQSGPLCQALAAWMHDPVGAVNATLIMIGHNQPDEAATWARENAERIVDHTVYDYVRSRAEKDLNLADAEDELTDSIAAAVQGAADEQAAARERLGRVLSIDLPVFLARAIPACANAVTPVGGD
jgi:hypothetical protein